MDPQNSSIGSMFGNYSSKDPSMDIPVTSGQNTIMSPYLNFDPAYVSPNADSQFIFPEGGGGHRGRFELAFSQIGGSVFVGATAGGINGIYNGIRDSSVQQLAGAAKRTQMLNFIAKQGASSAQTLGVIALMYSGIGVIMSKSRGAEDELNTIVAGTTTGLLYKCSAGLSKCLRAGAVGFGLSLGYSLYMSKDRVKQIMGID